MKERIKLSLQEELERETEELKKELERHPELADIKVSQEMDDVFFERARVLEKALKEERQRKEAEEAEFAEELMPDIEHLKREHTKTFSADKETVEEERKPVVRYHRKRKKSLFVALVAVLILVMGLSMTAVGSKSYFKVWWERFNGEDENPTKILNVDDMDVMKSDDGEEIAAYKRIDEELGINVVRIKYMPEDMFLDDVKVDETLEQASLFYQYGDEIMRYTLYLNDEDSSWGQKEGDKEINEYQIVVKNVEIVVKEYKVEDYEEYRRIANFEYKEVHYQLSGVMEKEEFDKILKNLHFF